MRSWARQIWLSRFRSEHDKQRGPNRQKADPENQHEVIEKRIKYRDARHDLERGQLEPEQPCMNKQDTEQNRS